MTASVDINAALVTAFQGTLAYPVGYEAHDFTPPDNAPWCGLFVLPASTMPAALGDKSPLEHVGILQIDIHHPLNVGTGPLLTDADTVAAKFDPGATFTYNSLRVMVERCERSSIRRDDAWLTVSLSVRWRAWQHRST